VLDSVASERIAGTLRESNCPRGWVSHGRRLAPHHALAVDYVAPPRADEVIQVAERRGVRRTHDSHGIADNDLATSIEPMPSSPPTSVLRAGYLER
jgi:hypothetical protein